MREVPGKTRYYRLNLLDSPDATQDLGDGSRFILVADYMQINRGTLPYDMILKTPLALVLKTVKSNLLEIKTFRIESDNEKFLYREFGRVTS